MIAQWDSSVGKTLPMMNLIAKKIILQKPTVAHAPNEACKS